MKLLDTSKRGRKQISQGPSPLNLQQNVDTMYVDNENEYQSDKMAALFMKIFLAPKSS